MAEVRKYKLCKTTLPCEASVTSNSVRCLQGLDMKLKSFYRTSNQDCFSARITD